MEKSDCQRKVDDAALKLTRNSTYVSKRKFIAMLKKKKKLGKRSTTQEIRALFFTKFCHHWLGIGHCDSFRINDNIPLQNF